MVVKPVAPPPKLVPPKPQPKAVRQPSGCRDGRSAAQRMNDVPRPRQPRPAARVAAPIPEPLQMEEPVIYKVERPKAVFPPEPTKTIMRRITSEPPRMGRVVAFADGRRGGNRNRTRGKAK